MKKAPSTFQASGALGKQLSFLTYPKFCPILPNEGSLPRRALIEMSASPITQIEWLKLGFGWRLSATINILNLQGWGIQSNRVQKGAISIAEYSLTTEARECLEDFLKDTKDA